MRPCALIIPDSEKIVSVTLQSYGFSLYSIWAQKIVLFFKLLETQVCALHYLVRPIDITYVFIESDDIYLYTIILFLLACNSKYTLQFLFSTNRCQEKNNTNLTWERSKEW